MDETEREMWEIAENFHRVDLSAKERSNHIKRYAELKTQKRELSDKVADKPAGPRGRPKSIATEIAEETGLSDRTVRRALNPPPATDPTKTSEPDQDKVYDKLCHWWRKADENTRENFVAAWITK